MRYNRFFFIIFCQITFLFCTLNISVFAQNDFWQKTNGPFGGHINTYAINNDGHIFAGTVDRGVFRSTNNGESWLQINTGLTEPDVFSLAINSDGDIFAGTRIGGVFRSTDNGDTWRPVNTGLAATFVRTLAINSSGDIFAGTFGGGVFRSAESTTAVEEIATSIPSSFSLEQNYPNPFNPSTTIEYSVQKAGNVRVKIHNTLGQLIRNLVNESKPIGEYSISWDGKNDSGRKVTSGTYFYQLQVGDFISTKKMLLILLNE